MSEIVYVDPRHDPRVTGHFVVLYWMIPIICMLGIPFAIYALVQIIPEEAHRFGFSLKLGVVSIVIVVAIVLGVHALAGFVIQAKRDFPCLIAAIAIERDGSIIIRSYTGRSRRYSRASRIELLDEEISDPLLLGIYWYSIHNRKHRSMLRVSDDTWMVVKRQLEAQETVERLKSHASYV